MLQQTQVATVLDYYARFLGRFRAMCRRWPPRELDEVLRPLERPGLLQPCPQPASLRARRGGRCMAASFRGSAEVLADPAGHRPLHGRCHRLVLFRRARGHPGRQRQAGAHAGARLRRRPVQRRQPARACGRMRRRCCRAAHVRESMPRYTQGLMDLGATVCLPRNPTCLLCPVSELCVARREGEPGKLSGQDAQAQAQRAVAVAVAGPRRRRLGVAGKAARHRHLGRAVLPAGFRKPRCAAGRGAAARAAAAAR